MGLIRKLTYSFSGFVLDQIHHCRWLSLIERVNWVHSKVSWQLLWNNSGECNCYNFMMIKCVLCAPDAEVGDNK